MTITENSPTRIFETATFNLYRDIHKGIRAELFGVTLAAGNTDPADRAARVALADRVANLATILEVHAHEEDREVQPATETHLPDVAEVIASDHARFDGLVESFTLLAGDVANAAAAARRERMEELYFALASFTGVYLAHQNLEERVVMPGLERALGVDACLGDPRRDRREHPARPEAEGPGDHAAGDEHRRPGRDARRHAAARAGRDLRGRVGPRRLRAARGRLRRARRAPGAVLTLQPNGWMIRSASRANHRFECYRSQ